MVLRELRERLLPAPRDHIIERILADRAVLVVVDPTDARPIDRDVASDHRHRVRDPLRHAARNRPARQLAHRHLRGCGVRLAACTSNIATCSLYVKAFESGLGQGFPGPDEERTAAPPGARLVLCDYVHGPRRVPLALRRLEMRD